MAHLMGFANKKSDEVELNDQSSRFQVSNVHDNAAFEDDEDDTMDYQGSQDLGEQHTTYMKTLQRLTREALPSMDLYRDVRSVHRQPRPSLWELHNDTFKGKDVAKEESPQETEGEGAVKFGWITGVMVRCLLNIWGPIMFLRLTYIVGRSGVIQGILIILLSDVITVITGLSISAISTNGMVKGGGTYYLISRSLGPEFGGAIGLLFAFANAVAVAMHTVGFSESLKDLLVSEGLSIVDGGLNDMRIIGVITVTVLVTITIVGMEWEQKAQVVLLVILSVAIADVVVGSFMPDEVELAKGFVGWNVTVFQENLLPSYRCDGDFFTMFSVFFPAATGILAGANISGDLKDPSVAIPKGTLLAILISSIVYIIFVFISGFCVLRDADGDLEHYYNNTFTNCNYSCVPNDWDCRFGLQNSYQVMEMIAAYGYLIYAGCFAATLSSALACLVSAPKIFQALCNDKLYPGIEWFGKGFGKNNEPIRSYVLAFLIAAGFIVIAQLNVIAPIISNFFMAAYCLINFACFHASFSKSPGFRPGFTYWNMWVSLIGAILSGAVMFIMDWKTALLTFFICCFLYSYLLYKKPDVNWGSSQQAVSYRTALKSVQDLVHVEDHVKNYRPQMLVLTGKVNSRPALIDFGYHVTKGLALMVCGHVTKNPVNYKERATAVKRAYSYLSDRKVKAFYSLIEGETLAQGTKALIQATGVGKLRPNILLMGYMMWQGRPNDEIQDYFNTIHAAFDSHLAVGILRTENGLDYSIFTEDEETSNKSPVTHTSSNASLGSMTSNDSSTSMDSSANSVSSDPEGKNKKNKKKSETTIKAVPKEIQSNLDMFRRKSVQKSSGVIDVWWLYDDGGLTLLIPYILTTRKYYQKSKLRVFSLANKNYEIDQQTLNLAALLGKFRINYSDVTVLPDVTKKPQEHSIREFELILSKYRTEEDSDDKNESLVVSDHEYSSMKEKTMRYIRVRELLLKHSRNSQLVVVTMPMPRKNRVSAPLYLAWLDALSKDMPPTLLIRGNQTSVLTFYS